MKNKSIVLITGASRGIGREIALEYGLSGHKVIINFIKEKESALSVVEEIKKKGGQADIYQSDISDYDMVTNMVKDISKNEGRINVLVNNAGVIKNKSILNMSKEDWEKVVQTDLTGTFFLMKECAKLMVKTGGGSIINIASIIGVRGAAGSTNYASAKAGLISLTKSAAIELGRFKICVNAILPGFHLTDIGKQSSEDYRDKARKESVLNITTDIRELAKFIVFLSQMKTISGQMFNWDSRII